MLPGYLCTFPHYQLQTFIHISNLLHVQTFNIIHSSNAYQILSVHTYAICHEKHAANIQSKIKKLVSMVHFH